MNSLDENKNVVLHTFPKNESYIKFDKDFFKENIYIPHAGEGKDRHSRGTFLYLKNKNRLGKNVAIIHAVALLEKDVQELAETGTSVIWSPRSNMALYGLTAPISLMKDYGITIALGTDWRPTGSSHLLDELHTASRYNKRYLNNLFSFKELWEMVTVNPSKILQVDEHIGDIRPGMKADLALFELKKGQQIKSDDDVYKALVYSDERQTVMVMRDGIILYGRKDFLKNLVPDDENEVVHALNHEYYVRCLPETTFSCHDILLHAENEQISPLFDDIEEENKIVDYPVNYVNENYPDLPTYDGIPTEKDFDADGIENEKDTDPLYFNPLRPIDLTDNDGKQTFARRRQKKTN